jgi:hypothetical protein
MHSTATAEIESLVSVHREQILRQEEARILTIARLPSNKLHKDIAAQLAAYSHAEDLFNIHEIAADKYEMSATPHREAMHRTFAAQAHQLKLLALDSIDRLSSFTDATGQ